MVIDRVIARTEELIGEEQCGFRRGRGCTDQVFVLKSLCEKYVVCGFHGSREGI